MINWILSVFSAVIIVTTLSLILPEGKISSFVKPFNYLAVMIIILSPLKNFDGTFEFSTEHGEEINVDENFLNEIISSKIDLIRTNCVKIAEENGINGGSAIIEYIVDDNYRPIIKSVKFNLANAVILSESEHIVILQSVKKNVSEYLNIDESMVMINEFENK